MAEPLTRIDLLNAIDDAIGDPDRAEDVLTNIRSMLQKRGYKIVPIEATRDMLDSALVASGAAAREFLSSFDCLAQATILTNTFSDEYRAAVAAAPDVFKEK